MMVRKMKEKPPVYKIKVGIDGDVDMVAAPGWKQTDAAFQGGCQCRVDA